jgi:hypothetical protein
MSELHSESARKAGGGFPWDDVVVLVFGILLAEPFCHVGADLIMHNELGRGLTSFAIGLPIGVAGASFHWWKDKVKPTVAVWVLKTADRGWPFALLFVFLFLSGVFGPRSSAPNTSPSADEIATAVVKALPKAPIPPTAPTTVPTKEPEPPNPLRPETAKWRVTNALVQTSKTQNLSCSVMLVRYQLSYAEEFANDLKQILDAARWQYRPAFALGDLPKGLSAIARYDPGMKRQCGETFQSAIRNSSSNWPGGNFLSWEGPNPEQTYDPSVDTLIAQCPNCFQVGIGNPWPK